jgi:hypothetical protein
VLKVPRRVAHVDRDRHQIDQPAEALFSLPENFVRLFAIGHVDYDLSSAKDSKSV